MVSRYSRSPSEIDMRSGLRRLGMKSPFESILFAARFVAEPEFDAEKVLCDRDWLLLRNGETYLLFTADGEESDVEVSTLGPNDIRFRLDLSHEWIQEAKTHIDEFDEPKADAGVIEVILPELTSQSRLTMTLSAGPSCWKHALGWVFGWSPTEPD